MKPRCNRTFLLATASALAITSASAQTVLITDNFESNSIADYTIVDDGTPDGTQDFAFDYIAAGIPLAPRSTTGDSKGLKLTANDTIGAVDAWSMFHNTSITAPRYRMTVDVWMNFIGSGPTTEFAHIGVASNGVSVNSYPGPVSGSGAFTAITGDGGAFNDFSWFRDAANTPVGDPLSTALPGTHASYLGHGYNASHAFYQTLFPSPPSTISGSPGNIWTTLVIEVDNVAGVISFFLDGTLFIQGDFDGTFNGQVSLGHVDGFSSLGTVTAQTFSVYDNLEVETFVGYIGMNYCMANANTTGSAAEIRALGSVTVADNNVMLLTGQMPSNSFGFFLTSLTQGFTANPGGSAGNLCLSGAIGRYVGPGQIQNSGVAGEISLQLDLAQTPTPTGPVSVMAGETWNYTSWFRDSNGMGGATSNFADGLEIVFL